MATKNVLTSAEIVLVGSFTDTLKVYGLFTETSSVTLSELLLYTLAI